MRSTTLKTFGGKCAAGCRKNDLRGLIANHIARRPGDLFHVTGRRNIGTAHNSRRMVARHLDPGLLSSEDDVIEASLGNAISPPAVDGRNAVFGQRGDGGCTAKRIDQLLCRLDHAGLDTIIASRCQAEKCDVRNCDNRSDRQGAAMDVSEIKERMAAAGYRQVDAANLLGLRPNQISLSLGGRRRFTVEEMDKLRTWLGDQAPHDTARVRMLPVIGQVAASKWSEAIRTTTDEMPAPDPNLPPSAFALDVVGDSMNRYVDDGGRIVVDPDDRALFPRRFYVVQFAGETTFKRFFADPARLEPCSDNPLHQTIEIGSGDGFYIVGRVIWRASRMPD